LDASAGILRGWMFPGDTLPIPVGAEDTQNLAFPSSTPSAVPPTQALSPTPEPTPTPLPPAVQLTSPAWEKQDWNNCGPTTLSLYLRTFGWEGDQYDIAELLKPFRNDKNVNVEELVYYVRNRAGWLRAEFRVGGDIALLKHLLAAGFPVMIEEGYYGETVYYPNDDRWLGHYLLVTGYDELAQTFTVQDTFLGANLEMPFARLDEGWKTFNRVYLLTYLPHQEETLKAILGPQWDPDANRQHALDIAREETEANAEDAFAWFNLASNKVYFEQYAEAANDYDVARALGLPQRMYRYQFGPFLAYFHAFRIDDLMALTEYALQRTDNSEEALLWRGWGFYRQGDTNAALRKFEQALEANPFYLDAEYAIDFVSSGP